MKVSFILLLVFGLTSTTTLAETHVVTLPGVPPCAEGHRYSVAQTALDEAAPGDRVVLCSGTYSGALRLNRTVILQSKNVTYDAIVVAPPGGHGIEVLADRVTVRGLVVRNASLENTSAVFIQGGDSTIENNILEGSWAGVLVKGGRNATVRSNQARNNTYGVLLRLSPGARVVENFMTRNDFYGVVADLSPNTSVVKNRFEDEGNGAIFLVASDHSRVADIQVNVTRCYGFGVKDSESVRVENNSFGYSRSFGGYIVGSSRNIEVVRNELHHSPLGQGVYVGAPDNVLLENDIHSNAGHGVLLSWFQGYEGGRRILLDVVSDQELFPAEIPDVRLLPARTLIQGNRITNNGRNGLIAEATNSTLILNNTFQRNGFDGINISKSLSLQIQGNLFEESRLKDIRLDRVRDSVLMDNRLSGPAHLKVSLVDSQVDLDKANSSSAPLRRTLGFEALVAIGALAAVAISAGRKR